MNIVSGEQIAKTFQVGKEQHPVLLDVSVAINQGEFISIMGPSGCGKSTLLYALSGMDSIDQGQVIFDGMDLTTLSDKELADLRRTKMGFVFQHPTFLKSLNILDNILLPAMRDERKNVRALTERALQIMNKMGIADLAKRDITQVSGGQLQRAGICRALISNPQVIFGDEPTGALNSTSAQEIMDLLASINSEGTTVMLVTHDPKIAARTERILFMSDGAIVNELRLPRFTGTDLDDRMVKVVSTMQKIGI
ncbi:MULTISPECIES: ABC transporter ATP-binding protein [Lysinibacillus]|uniref:ABC transporter ATP-binding protein n=1 Tax=Lysinibacillus capsici TaxID=2115968 RepID=A0ABY8KIJ8_9BACI|nr:MULTISPECIES: ABC transporter ATP-binding protein [Lysinibacillus]MCT1539046.1 ABC transporter ATP-binding protein [Lysinibacillus capsici]MCT1569737.1 ABC transporter ATP-binding protein [Lysinibacillus capsici]MCT1647195.1 ABC transporter ATP-binding protein [Lysinibacillus capsici]MCT1725736.1 ABC transporter ATP-binding protein [Lysinibacillus capsici]MCT1782857.1 ABC transporter ATP-binding protein [Lysinibacillus capsici]